MSNQPVKPWATTPTYPAGASTWSGTATKIAPVTDIITPNAPPSAQMFNWLMNNRDRIMGAVALGQWVAAVANWNPPTPDIGGVVLQNCPNAAYWDAFSGQWLVACGHPLLGVAGTLMCSYDGVRWFPIAGGLPGPTGRAPWAVATNPTTGDIALFCSDGTASSISRWAGGTGAGTDTVQGFLAGVDQGVMTFWNGAFWFVGASGLGTGSWTGAMATSTTGSGAWTNDTSSLPSGWASGTSDTVLEWLTAQTSSDLIVALCGKTVGTSTSRLMHQSTSSPGTWTDITPSLLGGTAKQIRGITYAPNDGLWGLLAVDGSNSYLYTSPDLSTWTLVQTFTGYQATGVSVIGSAWAVLAWNATLGEGGNRILTSIDVGAQGSLSTWQFGAYSEDVGGQATTPAANAAGLLLSNGQQLLRCEILRIIASGKLGGMVASSLIAGFAGNVPIVAQATVAATGPEAYGVDGSTLHRWICNDAASPLADTGAAANAPLTLQNAGNVNLGDVGIYSDATNFTQATTTSGWAKSANDTGNPTSTTALSLHLWVKPRSFTNPYPRLLAKGYNPTIVSPYDSFGIYLVNMTGQVALEWSSSGTLIQVSLGPSTTTARGYVKTDQWQHLAVTISISGGNASLAYYWNGNLIATATQASGAIDWHSGSSGPWVVGGVIASAPIANATFDGWIFDARVDDGISRSAVYFKQLYQTGVYVHS